MSAVSSNNALWTQSGSVIHYTTGNVGIGTTSPSVKLDVAGSIEYTGTITDVSDIRLKKDLSPLGSEMLESLTKINTYSFRIKDDEDGVLEYGVMAQELEEIFPILVRTAEDEMGTKSVNYLIMRILVLLYPTVKMKSF